MNRMFVWIASLAVVLAVGDATAQTGVIENDYVGCLTERYFNGYDIAVLSKDWGLRNDLMASACYELEGLNYSVVKKSFMSVRIQVTIDGNTFELTTYRDAIQ